MLATLATQWSIIVCLVNVIIMLAIACDVRAK